MFNLHERGGDKEEKKEAGYGVGGDDPFNLPGFFRRLKLPAARCKAGNLLM